MLVKVAAVRVMDVHVEFGYRVRWIQNISFVYSQASSINQENSWRKMSLARTQFFPSHVVPVTPDKRSYSRPYCTEHVS